MRWSKYSVEQFRWDFLSLSHWLDIAIACKELRTRLFAQGNVDLAQVKPKLQLDWKSFKMELKLFLLKFEICLVL